MTRRGRRKRLISARMLIGCALAVLSLGAAAAPAAGAESSIETETVIPCEGDACQPLPETPEDPTPGTLTPNGGNPPVRFPKAQGQPPRKKHKKHKQAKKRNSRRGHTVRR